MLFWYLVEVLLVKEEARWALGRREKPLAVMLEHVIDQLRVHGIEGQRKGR